MFFTDIKAHFLRKHKKLNKTLTIIYSIIERILVSKSNTK